MAGKFVWLRTNQGEAGGVQGVAPDQGVAADPDDPDLAVTLGAAPEVALVKEGPSLEVAVAASQEVGVDPYQDLHLGAGQSQSQDPNPGTGPNPSQDPNLGKGPNPSQDPNPDPSPDRNQGPSPNLQLSVDHHQGPSPDPNPSPQQRWSQWKERRIDRHTNSLQLQQFDNSSH